MSKDYQLQNYQDNYVKFVPQQNNKALYVVTTFFSTSELWHVCLGDLALHQSKHFDIPECNNFRRHGVRQIYPTTIQELYIVLSFYVLNFRGPYPHSTCNGSQCFLTIVDDHSRATPLHLMAHKSNGLSMLKTLLFLVKSSLVQL